VDAPPTGGEPRYAVLPWIVIRAPALPVEDYEALGDRDAVARLYASPLFRRAVAVASPSLSAALDRGDGTLGARARGARLRYAIRMATRPTPFGAFAGAALAEWGPRTTLRLRSEDGRLRTGPDVEWLAGLLREAETRPDVRRRLRVQLHPAAVVVGRRLTLAQRPPVPGGDADRHILDLRVTPLVRDVVELAPEPIRWTELLARMTTRHPGADPARVEAVLDRLWAEGVLLSELRPQVTAAVPAQAARRALDGVAEAHEELRRLDAVLGRCSRWDALPPAQAAAERAALDETTRAAVGVSPHAALRTDLALDLEGALGERVGEALARAADLSLRLGLWPTGDPALAAYRARFEDRYGRGRAVPVLELLDPSLGLGSPADEDVRGIEAPVVRQRRLAQLAAAAFAAGRREVELDDALLADLAPEPPAAPWWPASLEVFAAVAARSSEDIDAGAFRLVLREVRAAAPGAVAARFADVLEPDGPAALRETVKAADPADGRLRAEVVCLPMRLSAANAVVHPPLRAWEVVLDAAPGVPSERVIPLRELAVVLDGGRLAIVWPRADREVDLQEHTALNRTLLPAPLAALRLLARDGQAIPGPHVQGVEHLPFVPRLVCGQVVVATAHWHLDARAHGDALPVDDAAAFAPALRDWRARWRMDRHVYLRSDDNRLLLDLDDAEQREQLRQALAAADRPVTLEEALPRTGDAWLPGPRGRHAMELTATLRLEVPTPRPPAAAARPVAAAERTRAPGGDWLYLKLYAPAATHEDLVAGPVRELCAEALACGAADLWFFLRYHDPDPHIRLRLHGEPQRLAAELWPRVAPWLRALVDDGWCHRVALDTYEREVERYGGPESMDRAERAFAADSQAVADLLRLRARGRLRLERTLLAVASLDLLLQGLGLPGAERLAWARGVRGHEAGERFRAEQGLLRLLLDEGLGAAGEDEAAAVLTRRAEALRAQPPVDVSVPVAGALAHMHCNRLLGTDRADEEAVFELWARTVRSVAAMQRVGRMSS